MTRASEIAEIRRLRRNATRKIRRIKTALDVDSRLKKFDPRLTVGAEKSMTIKELREYKQALTQFNSRRTQFVRGNNNAVLSKSSWREYKRVEARYNKVSSEYYSQFRGIKTWQGITTNERMKDINGVRHLQSLADVARPSRTKNRGPGGFTSEKNLQLTTMDLEAKANLNWFKRKNAKDHKDNLIKLYENSDPATAKTLKRMTLKQIEYLWNFEPHFVANAAMLYEDYVRGVTPDWQSNLLDNARVNNASILKHAKKHVKG